MKKLLLVWVLVMAFISTSLAQTRQVTGKVTSSEDGTALILAAARRQGSQLNKVINHKI